MWNTIDHGRLDDLSVPASAVAIALLAAFRWGAARRERESASQGAPTGGRFVQAADVQMLVQEAGDRAAPAVLFVHGTGAWSETWREAMNAVAAAGYRAIAVDLPPFGYSQRPDPPRYEAGPGPADRGA
jgi:alpha-beta hydrolase superfamily lysophospholipase